MILCNCFFIISFCLMLQKKLQVLPCHDLAWSTNGIPQLCVDSVHFLMAPNPSTNLSRQPRSWSLTGSNRRLALGSMESAKRENNSMPGTLALFWRTRPQSVGALWIQQMHERGRVHKISDSILVESSDEGVDQKILKILPKRPD